MLLNDNPSQELARRDKERREIRRREIRQRWVWGSIPWRILLEQFQQPPRARAAGGREPKTNFQQGRLARAEWGPRAWAGLKAEGARVRG
ncbi:unnamed protein product [Prunus armeniaca]